MSVGFVTIALWISMAFAGAIVAAVNLRAARGDRKYQLGKQEQQWRRVLIAKVNATTELLRLAAHTLLFVAGVLVAWRTEFNPNPPGTSLYVRCVLLFVIAALLTETLLHRWLRHRLTKPLKEAA